MSTPKRLLVVDVAALGWDQAGRLEPNGLKFQKLETVFPAVTCTAQATFRTASLPERHGMVSNGIFFRELRKPMFWEQAATLVTGERIWKRFREQGHRVGMMFWQQSLGEELDLVLSPKPVHKHGGGMLQDCYSQPHDLYEDLCRAIGRRFNLMHYWGPLASRKSSEWIVAATKEVMRNTVAPDLLLTYLPHLDYDLQRFGPGSDQALAATQHLNGYLVDLGREAETRGYDVLFFGDYAMREVTGAPVFPNRALRDANLLAVRLVNRRAYPDFFSSQAMAMVDHEVAHVFCADAAAAERARGVLERLPGVAETLGPEEQKNRGLGHARSGELVLVADEGCWFAYPWWAEKREAPDYATHVDIHNKPGYDPCELFFGWPPPSVSQDPGRLRGSHGGSVENAAWASTCKFEQKPRTLLDLADAVRSWLTASP